MHVFCFEKTSLNCHLYVFLFLLLLSFTFKSRNQRGLWVELYKTQSLISLKYIAFLWQSNDMLTLYTVIQGKMELMALPELTLKWHHSWSNSVVKPITSAVATMNEWIMGSQSEWHAGNEGFYNAYKSWERESFNLLMSVRLAFPGWRWWWWWWWRCRCCSISISFAQHVHSGLVRLQHGLQTSLTARDWIITWNPGVVCYTKTYLCRVDPV